jgi:hypothetical protein
LQVRNKRYVSELDILKALVEPKDEFSYYHEGVGALLEAFAPDKFINTSGIAAFVPFSKNIEGDKLLDVIYKNLSIIPRIDPSHSQHQLLLYHDGKRIRISPFGATDIYQIEEQPLKDGTLFIARNNLLQPVNVFSQVAINTLEDLINSEASELEFQRFFEKHPEFLLSLNYKQLHPQLILYKDTGEKLIPDFFLERFNDNFVDILDLKLAHRVLTKFPKNRSGFCAALYEAINQLREYRNWFDDKHNRKQFYDLYGLRAYKPRVVVVIGRKHDYYSDVERWSIEFTRSRLEDDLPRYVNILTYDDIIDKARQFKKIALS